MSKTISIRVSDDDLRYLDYLSRRYYDCPSDTVRLALSPVIRAALKLAYQILFDNPDVRLVDPCFPYTLPDRFYPESYDLDTGDYIYGR